MKHTFPVYFVIILIFTTIVGSFPTHAQEKGLYWGFGITNHNYIYDGSFFIDDDQVKFFNTVNSVPTLSLGYRIPKIKSEIELSYYMSYVAAADLYTDLVFSKSAFSADYTVVLGKFRAGLFYSYINEKHLITADLPPNQDQQPGNKRSGIGLKLGFESNGFAFDIRKENVIRFYRNAGIDMEPLVEQWNFRITKRMAINSEAKTENKNGPFSLTLGMMASGNYLIKETDSKPPAKLMPTLGIEYLFKPVNLSVYVRRAMWLNIEAYDRNFTFTNQLNYLGLSYHLILADKHLFKIGLHHLWNQDKSSIFLDKIDNIGETDGRFFVYENKGIGLDLRYAISPSWDATMNLDYYYKANHRIGTGFNPESFRIGLLYNLR